MKRMALGFGAALLTAANAAAAHPGHGLGSDGVLHHLTEPLHVAPLAVLALGLAFAWRRRARVPR